MRIKDLFTVPEGKSVTEKMFGRVLLSSVCGILLCMVCLAGTTWAWFSVSLENNGNVIHIAEATVEMKVNDSTAVAAGQSLTVEATDRITVKLISYDGVRPIYVVLSVDYDEDDAAQKYYWIEVAKGEPAKQLAVNASAKISYDLSWVKPVGADAMAVATEDLPDEEQEDDELTAESPEEEQSQSGEALPEEPSNDEAEAGSDENVDGTSGVDSEEVSGGDPDSSIEDGATGIPDSESDGDLDNSVNSESTEIPDSSSDEAESEVEQTSAPENAAEQPSEASAEQPAAAQTQTESEGNSNLE